MIDAAAMIICISLMNLLDNIIRQGDELYIKVTSADETPDQF